MTVLAAYGIYQRAQVPQFTGDADKDADILRDWLNLELGNIQPAIPVRATKTVKANYSLTVADDIVLVDATAGAVTITFPDPTRVQHGTWTVKKVDASANTVTLSAIVASSGAAATFDGATSQVIAVRYTALTMRSDGAVYWIV